MFNNIGGKLKILAWIEFIGGMVSSVIAGIIYLVIASKIEASTYNQAYITTISTGIAFLIVGPIASWIGSCNRVHTSRLRYCVLLLIVSGV